ncbi:MAG: hypothetical protein E6Q51_05050 [Methylophilus methylotrophus]|uniref:Single-stranded DNA-binding protein n=1 Tax=Methylophilus methylotrophus TaxID=17 RepID=A0A5C7WHX7_METME|nr:MAG: hypothetical protein E6Q51_05050 [Methylophilus methylotrophus]
MAINIQVLSIGTTESGKNGQGREWHRRTFQVFDIDDQVAGNIPVYGDLDKLNSYTTGGKYTAVIRNRAGDNGRLVPSIVDLIPLQQQPQPKASA